MVSLFSCHFCLLSFHPPLLPLRCPPRLSLLFQAAAVPSCTLSRPQSAQAPRTHPTHFWALRKPQALPNPPGPSTSASLKGKGAVRSYSPRRPLPWSDPSSQTPCLFTLPLNRSGWETLGRIWAWEPRAAQRPTAACQSHRVAQPCPWPLPDLGRAGRQAEPVRMPPCRSSPRGFLSAGPRLVSACRRAGVPHAFAPGLWCGAWLCCGLLIDGFQCGIPCFHPLFRKSLSSCISSSYWYILFCVYRDVSYI